MSGPFGIYNGLRCITTGDIPKLLKITNFQEKPNTLEGFPLQNTEMFELPLVRKSYGSSGQKTPVIKSYLLYFPRVVLCERWILTNEI